jgi:hypothetical protein
MKQDNFYRALGILIIIAFIGSMFGALLYAPQPSNNNTPPPTQSQKSYNYSIAFDTEVIQELQAIRIFAETSYLDIDAINLDIQKLEGVARVQFSEFRKNGENWGYFAQIDLKKQASPAETALKVLDLNYFSGYKEAKKRVSISTPKEALDLYNADLNVTRKFTFEYPTTFTIADLNTMPEDNIMVNGTIQLREKEILFLELIETNNYTQTPDINIPIDLNNDEMIDMNEFDLNKTNNLN